jgi:hypothetical protein
MFGLADWLRLMNLPQQQILWHVSVTASEFRFRYICTLSDYRLLSVRLHVYSLRISSNRYYGSISDLSALVLGAILGTLPSIVQGCPIR